MGITEESRFKKLKVVTPEAGDILITKIWTNKEEGTDSKKDEDKSKSDAFFIRTGQALFSRIRRGSMNSEHAALCAGGNPIVVCEANGGGVRENQIDDRDKLVFRCTDQGLRAEAVHVAAILCNGIAGKAPGHYAWDKAVKSIFKFKALMGAGKRYLELLYNKVYGDAYGDFPPMFCSEFVTACYELASMRLNIRCLYVDPRAVSPKCLEGLLYSSQLFVRWGRTKPPVLSQALAQLMAKKH